MDKDRAKQLLQAIHSCQESGCDEECAAACELLEDDPELQRWFEEEMGGWSKFDQEVAKKFECCEASEKQKEICKSRACAVGRGPMKFVAPLLAAAALFVVGFFLFGGGSGNGIEPLEIASSGSDFPSFVNDLASAVDGRQVSLQHQHENVGDLKIWLTSHSAPVGKMRPCVTSKVGVGCAVLDWSSREVSMVCFQDSTCGGVVHVFIIERSVLGDPDVESQIAQKSRHRGLDTGGWVDEENVYLMIGDTPDVSLDSLLSS